MIEPTEEQKQAAKVWAADEWGSDAGFEVAHRQHILDIGRR